MSGAPIPNDWDGTTYKCYRINWPHSEQYEAILLGQMTEPINETYWDASTGDPSEPSAATKEAYRSTLIDFWAKECDEPVIPDVPAFRVYKTIDQAIPVGVWTTVQWEQFWFNNHNPGFSLLDNFHAPKAVGLDGLWRYDVNLYRSPFVGGAAGQWGNTGELFLFQQLFVDTVCSYSTLVDFSNAAYTTVDVQFLADDPTTLSGATEYLCTWSGTFLGNGA